MIRFTDFFEAITFFGEIVIGQIGFQVIAISLGRRGLGEWKPQDSMRFVGHAFSLNNCYINLLCPILCNYYLGITII